MILEFSPSRVKSILLNMFAIVAYVVLLSCISISRGFTIIVIAQDYYEVRRYQSLVLEQGEVTVTFDYVQNKATFSSVEGEVDFCEKVVLGTWSEHIIDRLMETNHNAEFALSCCSPNVDLPEKLNPNTIMAISDAANKMLLNIYFSQNHLSNPDMASHFIPDYSLVRFKDKTVVYSDRDIDEKLAREFYGLWQSRFPSVEYMIIYSRSLNTEYWIASSRFFVVNSEYHDSNDFFSKINISDMLSASDPIYRLLKNRRFDGLLMQESHQNSEDSLTWIEIIIFLAMILAMIPTIMEKHDEDVEEDGEEEVEEDRDEYVKKTSWR